MNGFIFGQYAHHDINQQIFIYRWARMKRNQYGSNFSNENMTQSVKLADVLSGDNEPNSRKQFLKYPNPRVDQSDLTEDKQKNQMKFYEMADIKPIKTEPSQVSREPILPSLKKLNQLRSEFEKIKNMPIQRKQQQAKISASNSQSRLSHPNQDPSSSVTSSKYNKKDTNQREERLWQVERKQYEIMLNNCQIKIEQLLHNQMEYKKTIHELRSFSIISKSPPEVKPQGEIKELQKLLKQQKQKSYKLTTQIEKLKLVSKQQTQKITKLESENTFRFKDESKGYEERKKMEEALRLQKDRYLNCDIERRKYQMQNELLQREKEQQITRIQRQIDHEKVVHQHNLKSLCKKFEDQIEIKDRRYMLLLSQYQKLKREQALNKVQNEKPNQSNQQLYEIFKRLMQEKKNNPINQELSKTVKLLIQKLETKKDQKQYQRPATPQRQLQSSSSESEIDQRNNPYVEKLLSEIRILKAEIEALRNTGQGIDLQPMKKMYEAQIAALKDTIAILQRKAKKYNSPLSESKQFQPLTPSRKDKQIRQLQRKIRELEENAKQKQISFSIEQQEQLILKERRKIEQIENELRAEKRKRNQSEFEAEKLKKQIEFRVGVLNNQRLSQLKIKDSEIERANQNILYWKNEFENMKRFYEQKLVEKNRIIEQFQNSKQIQLIKKRHEENLDKAKFQYDKQVKALAERFGNYKTTSLQYDDLLKKYTALQNSYLDLKSLIFKSKQINDGIDHLWQIKQTEYANVSEILHEMKKQKEIGSSHGVYQKALQSNFNQKNQISNSSQIYQPSTATYPNQQKQYFENRVPLSTKYNTDLPQSISFETRKTNNFEKGFNIEEGNIHVSRNFEENVSYGFDSKNQTSENQFGSTSYRPSNYILEY